MAWTLLLLAALAAQLLSAEGAQPCSTAVDCPERHCCVDNKVHLIGRRAASLPEGSPVPSLPGTCEPVKPLGEECDPSVLHAFRPPTELVSSCPCKAGLLCAPYFVKGIKHGMCSMG